MTRSSSEDECEDVYFLLFAQDCNSYYEESVLFEKCGPWYLAADPVWLYKKCPVGSDDGGSSSDGNNGNNPNNPNPPDPDEDEGDELKVEVNCTAGEVTVLEDYNIDCTITGNESAVTKIVISMQRNGAVNNWTPVYECVGNNTEVTYRRTARTPSYWQIKADAYFADNTMVTSHNVEYIEENFPSADKILKGPLVKYYFDVLWGQTKAYAEMYSSPSSEADTTGYRVVELGCWVMLNTDLKMYTFNETMSDPVRLLEGNETVKISIDPPPNDLYAPDEKPTLTVAHFHTHFPICFARKDCRHDCGPAPEDIEAVNRFKVPGFVYDYVGSVAPGDSVNRIINIHGLHDEAQIFTYGRYSKRPIIE